MANLHAKVLVTSILSMAVTVGSVSAEQSVSSISAVSVVESHISATYEIIPQKELARQFVTATEAQRFDITKVLIDISLTTESMVMSFSKKLADSVTMSDVVNKIINTSADFDPSDADIDFDPITVSDSKRFGVGKKLSDAVISTDSNSKRLTRPMQENISATEVRKASIDKPVSESVNATESMAKTFIRPNVSDSTSIAESAAKNFSTSKSESVTSSDASNRGIGKNVPEVLNASESLGPFTVGKSLVDTPIISEAMAKDFIRPNVADTVGSTESASKQPNLNKTESLTATDAINTKHIQPKYTENISATDTLVPVLTIGGASGILNTQMVNQVVLNG